ncbi:MAG TPA: substrate-binding domain-containing protein [Salinimicrobium sp.]|nr:substrate-binding domain-containing protein [Salinimicrobium sp.]
MRKINVGGVPEHFNLPWHLCLEEGAFIKAGLQVNWKDFPDGTGAMCAALRSREIDLAVILTEGITKDIIAGNPSKIVQEYIGTPLIWGIHVAANSDYRELEDLKNEKVAVSRMGSGSHLMAYINAKNLNWNPEELEFEVVGNTQGAIEALENGKAGYFLWEHFTTKPLVDNGTFRRLGDCTSPWPCFVIAGNSKFLKNNRQALSDLLGILNETTEKFKSIPGIGSVLSKKYQQKPEDIEQWLKLTNWSQKQISIMEIDRVQEELLELGLIEEKQENSRFLDHF